MIFRILFVHCLMLINIGIYANESEEFTVKSAFMLKMTHFIEWPSKSDVYDSAKTEFIICVEHDHDFDNGLKKWAETGQIKNKKVKIKYFSATVPKQSSCDILYISNNNLLNKHVDFSIKNNVLTVTDVPGSEERGVIISFINIDGKLRFNVNLGVAKEQGFILSPRLLRLATNVIGGRIE